MNVCESDVLAEIFSSYGMLKTSAIADSDIVILNTCAVRSQAEQKAFSYIGRLEDIKKQNPNIKIVIIGCMAERLGTRIKKRFKNVNLVLGTNDIDKIALRIINLCGIDTTHSSHTLSNKTSPITGSVTIMRGCDNFCSYCVVPFVRGRETSLSSKSTIEQCKKLVENGSKEIILLGQNVNSYKYNQTNFIALVKGICEIGGLKRLRFMTNHPKDLSDELIDLIANEEKVCPHIHLPIQSGSNKILKAMNRKYTYEHYLDLVSKLRFKISEISITTDIIVGFPGETDKDFNDTLEAIRSIRFNGLYVFKYSPRPNTKASDMSDDVPLSEKKNRLSIILNESNKISSEIVSSMVGKKLEVLTDNFYDNTLEAKTRTGRKVFIKNASKDYLGKILDVYIEKSKVNSLFGEIV